MFHSYACLVICGSALTIPICTCQTVGGYLCIYYISIYIKYFSENIVLCHYLEGKF